MKYSNVCFQAVLFICLIGLTGCATVSLLTPQRTALAADRVVLPSFKEAGMLWIDAKINGAGPFRLLLDTGCDGLTLSQTAAEAAGLKPFSKVPMRGAYGGGFGMIAQVKRLESGGLTLADLPAIIVNDADLANFATASGIHDDGVLGMAALRGVLLELDFPQGQVVAVKRGTQHYPSDRAVAYKGNRPIVTLEIGGKSWQALIDTGSNGELGIPLLDDVPLLYPMIKQDAVAVGFGREVRRPEQSQLAGEARLGPVTWINPPLHNTRNGEIGVAALNSWELAIDQHAHRIYFLGDNPRLSWNERRPAELRFRPGYSGSFEGNGLRLTEVDPGGAYDLAGLRVGDVILTIDGLPALDYAYGRVSQAAQNNKRPKLQVLRAGKEFETTPILGPDKTETERSGREAGDNRGGVAISRAGAG